MTVNPKTPSERARQQGIRMNAQKAVVRNAVRTAKKQAAKPHKAPKQAKASRRTSRSSGDGGALFVVLFYLLTKKWFWITIGVLLLIYMIF